MFGTFPASDVRHSWLSMRKDWGNVWSHTTQGNQMSGGIIMLLFKKCLWGEQIVSLYCVSMRLQETIPQVSNHFINKMAKFGNFIDDFVSNSELFFFLFYSRSYHLSSRKHTNRTTLKIFLCYIRHRPPPHVWAHKSAW